MELITPKTNFSSDFKIDFFAYLLTVFETFEGVREVALNKVILEENKKKIKEFLVVKTEMDLENEETVSSFLENEETIIRMLGLEFYSLLKKEYLTYFEGNQLSQKIASFIKTIDETKVNFLLSKISLETGRGWKSKKINLFVVDSYRYPDESIEGLSLGNYLFIGWEETISNKFYVILLHELIHLNLGEACSEEKVSEITLSLIDKFFPEENSLRRHFLERAK